MENLFCRTHYFGLKKGPKLLKTVFRTYYFELKNRSEIYEDLFFGGQTSYLYAKFCQRLWSIPLSVV